MGLGSDESEKSVVAPMGQCPGSIGHDRPVPFSGSQHGFQALLEGGAVEENAAAAGVALEADVGADAHDRPLVSAARMRLAHPNDVANCNLNRHGRFLARRLYHAADAQVSAPGFAHRIDAYRPVGCAAHPLLSVDSLPVR